MGCRLSTAELKQEYLGAWGDRVVSTLSDGKASVLHKPSTQAVLVSLLVRDLRKEARLQTGRGDVGSDPPPKRGSSGQS